MSATNELWNKFAASKTLKRGWHLARTDSRQDFLNNPLYSDPFSVNFEQGIAEILRRVKTDSYRPHPLINVSVPKNTLAIRPGSVPAIEDRIVLQAIVYVLATEIDDRLPSRDKCNVYSYRLKDTSDKRVLFKESDVLDIPYISRNTILEEIDPFDVWYDSWPEFDEKSRQTFKEDGFTYLAISDIAAYFENVQLPILRDQLIGLFPKEQKLINFLLGFLERWTVMTPDGLYYHRGIPQGTQISSFLGNIFLLPLDNAFGDFVEQYEARYYRYMDDVRVFTAEPEDARRAIQLMDEVLRSQHLNIQSAKTEILDESKNAEITKRLIDVRIDEINALIEVVNSKQNIEKHEWSEYLKILRNVAKKTPYSSHERPIIGAQKPLRGLTLRAFRRWITAHQILKSNNYVDRLIREIQINPDFRLTRKLIATTRQFPKNAKIGNKMYEFLMSRYNIYPHQEAEIIYSLRYLSRLNPDVIEYVKKKFLDSRADPYVRMQSAFLLGTRPVKKGFVNRAIEIFEGDDSIQVKSAAISIILNVPWNESGKILHDIMFHPNNNIRNIGKLLREVRFDEEISNRKMNFIFETKFPWRICDNMHLILSMLYSDRIEIVENLGEKLKSASRDLPILDIREYCMDLASRAMERKLWLQRDDGEEI